MKLMRNIKSYIEEKNYQINIINSKVNIVNYIEIKEFSDTKIIVKHEDGYTTVNGKSLVITKMLENEILIIGTIKSIELR